MRAQSETIGELVARAERLGRGLARRALDFVPCHGDIHAGNVLIAEDGALYIVDWDTVILAPKERDLMFVGAGISGRWHRADQAEWFYRGYGPADVDPATLAYYRGERIVQDIAAFCDQILVKTAGEADRRQALQWLGGQFEPGQEVDIARESYRASAAWGLA
jgi:spectinomycin phosphotransferase